MSLRDALVKAKIATKADLRKVNQELALERRQKQARREARSLVEAREEDARRRAQAEAIQHVAEERVARQAAVERTTRLEQASQILRHHRLDLRPGPQRFWHRAADGRFLHRLDLPERVAVDLRAGRLAVAAIDAGPEATYGIIPADIARRIQVLCPERLVHWNNVPPDSDDPAERLYDLSA